ncbi:MAG: alkyl hydroperoxide reductase/Thiol specific antioxidant/Mal allergen [Chitinophagaceae bacterium]|nr:alkyl hydroperoxide reductase/Thiol specific antioxidant/Mal allergen [Chitinophagaceae bacterium]
MVNNYKAILIFSILSLFAGVLNSQHRFSLSGVLPARYKGADVFLTSDNSNLKKIAGRINNGTFYLEGSIKEDYEAVRLTLKRHEKTLASWPFFIQGGKIRVSILSLKKDGTDNLRFDNVPFVEEQRKYNLLLKPVEDSLQLIFKLLSQVDNNIRIDYKRDSLLPALRKLENEKLELKIQFIRSIPHSYLALYLLNSEIIQTVQRIRVNADTLMSVYSLLTNRYKESLTGKAVYSYILKRQSLSINNTLPDFTFITNEGERYSVSNFRNSKYVLLCFWDAGCKPCIKSIPFFAQMNSLYKDKGLQLISVSMDKDELTWISSLKRHPMQWLQTCDLPELIEGERIKKIYSITNIPQYFLLNKEGKLIYHNLQLMDDDDYSLLIKKLKQLLD